MDSKPHPRLAQDICRTSFIFVTRHFTLHISGTSCKFRTKRKRRPDLHRNTYICDPSAKRFISSNRCPNCGWFFTACSLRYLLLGCDRLLWHWDTDPRHCYSSPPQKGFRISPGGDELSPSTVPSLNNQAEKSASVVVLERWWFTTAGRQEMLPVQHCRLIAGHGKQGKTGMRRLKTKQLSCVWRWIHPLCPKLQSQCTPIWDSSPSFLTRRRVRQDMKTPKQFPKGSGEWCWWGGSCMCPCGMKSLGETCLPLSLVLMTLSLPFQPMLWWWLAARK